MKNGKHMIHKEIETLSWNIRQSVPMNSIVINTLEYCKVQSVMILHYMNPMDSPDFGFSSRHHMFLCNRTMDPMNQIDKMFLRYRIQLFRLPGSRLDILFDKVHCQLAYSV